MDGPAETGSQPAPLPTHKELAAQYGISAGTAHRVTALLASEGLVEVSRGRRATVIGQPPPEIRPSADPATAVPASSSLLPPYPTAPEVGRPLLDLEIRRLGRTVKRLTTEANPGNAGELRQLLIDALTRDGQDESRIAEYEMDIRYSGESEVLTTFVATAR